MACQKTQTLPALILALTLLGCNNNPTGPGPDNTPALGSLSPLGAIYVAYPSPDPSSRSDSLALTFDYNASKVSAITARLTLDSGRSWNTLAIITPNSGNKGSVTWVPKDSVAPYLEFFGLKTGYIRIEDLPSSASVNSDTFSLYGSLAVELTKPVVPGTSGRNDTLMIEYSQNQDISGFFSPYFRSDNMDEWVLIAENEKVSQSLPFKYFLAKLVPQDYIVEVNRLNDNKGFEEPIRILVIDYQRNAMDTSASITIVP